ncbi:MAG: preprotein translocase subunit SecY, partial [Methylobacteriaceae bacterium]|nr:preprotein translocase subunit SecY [Methylobacteriaceae bacterium]
RQRILFVFFAFAWFVFMIHVQLPNVNQEAWQRVLQSGAFYNLLGFLSGGALQKLSIIAMGITPYINASIIMQLMTVVMPQLEELAKKGGEEGRKKISQYTRWLTIVLAAVQATFMAISMERSGVFYDTSTWYLLYAIVAMVGGTLFLMWLGEQITSRGIGNGSSLIIFAGIVAHLPTAAAGTLELGRQGAISTAVILGVIVMAAVVVAFIVFMERAQRRLLINYPKRQVGNRMYEGQTSFLPLKLNTSGVIPPIFASSLLLLPATFASFSATQGGTGFVSTLAAFLGHGRPAYMILYAALIVFFAFFYTAIVFNPQETAENLKKHGGFIPGIRPGERTAEQIDYVLTRITVIGAAYLTVICLLPELLISYAALPFYLGGTSLLIVVSVTMDTVAQVHGHLLAHQYEGLVKKAKLRGARRR